MKLRSSPLAFLLLSFLVVNLVQAQGNIFLSNLNEPSDLGVSVGSSRWLAISFVTGVASSGYTLNSIQVEISGVGGDPGSYGVMLYGDNGGQPGGSLGALPGLTPTGPGVYTYTSSSMPLSPLTTYWIVAKWENSSADVFWSIPTSGAYTSTEGWMMNTASSFTSTDNSSWDNYSGSYLNFAVNATAVPEPSALTLSGLVFGLLTLANIGRFRKCTVYLR
jgi:hypothetical protein